MKKSKLIICLFITFFFTGCSFFQPVKLPPVSTYTIISVLGVPNYHPKTNLTLLVTLPIASPGYDTASMVYVTVPYRLRAFVNNRWIAPPAQMLLPVLAQGIRNANYFRAVVLAPFGGVADYRLDTQLLVLHQEFFEERSVVRLVMQATLINNNTNRVIASQRFQELVPAGNDPYSGVLAANQAAMRISMDIRRFVLNCH